LAAQGNTALAAVAQDLPIDDFSTGNYQSPDFYYGATHDSIQYGAMMGGSRDTNLNVCPGNTPCPTYNPYHQPSSYSFVPATATTHSTMVQSSGFYVGPRIDMGYGYHAYMNENFTPYKLIRLNFTGLSQALNFNVQLFTGTSWAQGGCNLAPYSGPFSIELPLSKFIATKGFTLSSVNLVDFIFQNGSVIGSVGFGITSIELSNAPKTGALSCQY
jgi:hypothetical protein